MIAFQNKPTARQPSPKLSDMNRKQSLSFYICLVVGCLMLFFITACKAPGNKIYTTQLPEPTKIGSIFYQYVKKIQDNFGILFTRVKEHDYFVFLDNKKENLWLLPIKDTTRHYQLDFTKYGKSMGDYLTAKATGDSLWVLDFTNKLLYQFKIDPANISLDRVFNLESITEGGKYFINHHQLNTFEIKYPFAYIMLGNDKERKNNYFDESLYFRISLNDSTKGYNHTKVLHTPRDFRKKKYYKTLSFLKIYNDSMALYGFASLDSVYTYNYRSNRYTQKALFNEFSKCRVLDKKQMRDLGYLRWYEFTNEVNTNMFHTQSHTVIIKKLLRQELTDSVMFEYYVLDSNLQVTYNNRFSHPIGTYASFPYQKGFIVFGVPFNTIYYYEVD
jgi:hypothetical protein